MWIKTALLIRLGVPLNRPSACGVGHADVVLDITRAGSAHELLSAEVCAVPSDVPASASAAATTTFASGRGRVRGHTHGAKVSARLRLCCVNHRSNRGGCPGAEFDRTGRRSVSSNGRPRLGGRSVLTTIADIVARQRREVGIAVRADFIAGRPEISSTS